MGLGHGVGQRAFRAVPAKGEAPDGQIAGKRGQSHLVRRGLIGLPPGRKADVLQTLQHLPLHMGAQHKVDPQQQGKSQRAGESQRQKEFFHAPVVLVRASVHPVVAAQTCAVAHGGLGDGVGRLRTVEEVHQTS